MAPTYQLHKNNGCFYNSQSLISSPEGACPHLTGQHDSGVLHKLPRQCQVVASLRNVEASPHMGTVQSAFLEVSAPGGQIEPESRPDAMGSLQGNRDSTHKLFWDIFGKTEVKLFSSVENSY